MSAIFISGIFMSFFITFLLLTKRHKALSDKILAVWVAVIGLHLLNYYIHNQGYWEQYPHLVGVTAPFPLLHGPFLYLYTLYSLRSDTRLRRVDYLHFAPAALAYLYMSPFFFFYSAREKAMVDAGTLPDFAVFSSILLVAFIVSGLAYALLSYRLTLQHKRKIKEHFSYREGINLNWLRNCILGIAIFFLTAAVVVILREGLGTTFPFNSDYIFYTVIIVFIFYLGYFGIRHQDMFTHNPETVNNIDPKNGEEKYNPVQTEKKYQRSGLKPEILNELHEKLIGHMEEAQPYLDPKLNLAGLAAQLEISPNQLSQVINQKEQVNFHDFVNKYRIEEFVRRASQNKSFSLLAHALDAGFNSKSSFNGIFKKHKGRPPSQYLARKTAHHTA
jgi:AraC-like DNA-binding protein